MTADVRAGWLLIGLVVVSSWLAAAAAWWWQHRRPCGLRDQKDAVAGLCRRIHGLEVDAARLELALAEARLDAALTRAQAAGYAARADRASGHAAALAEDVVALQHQSAAAFDRLRLAELDKHTDWEVDTQ